MSSKVSKLVEDLVTPIALNLGYEVIDVEYVKKNTGMTLTIFIDKEGGITLDDCEAFSQAIDGPLDELDPTNNQSYTLNVSSPGIDRPLKNAKDFKRNIGKEVTAKFYASVDGKKEVSGILDSYTDETITLKSNNTSYTFELSKISQIVPIIKL